MQINNEIEFLHKEVKLLKNKYDALSERIDTLYENNRIFSKRINDLCGDALKLSDNANRIYRILEVLININYTYATTTTVNSIMSSDRVLSTKETSIILLNNLITEYSIVIARLKNKVALSEDNLERERLKQVIIELENISILISTISPDSSDGYIGQIYNEIFVSVDKIKNV
jgi:septal ring factor EnvC (AmiA/AmiB activator)